MLSLGCDLGSCYDGQLPGIEAWKCPRREPGAFYSAPFSIQARAAAAHPQNPKRVHVAGLGLNLHNQPSPKLLREQILR